MCALATIIGEPPMGDEDDGICVSSSFNRQRVEISNCNVLRKRRKRRTDADKVLLNFAYKLPSILASIGILKRESNIKFRFWICPNYQSIYQIDCQTRNA